MKMRFLDSDEVTRTLTGWPGGQPEQGFRPTAHWLGVRVRKDFRLSMLTRLRASVI